jgi:hypothetical protein
LRTLTTHVELPPRASVTFQVPRGTGTHDVSIGVADGALVVLEGPEGQTLDTLAARGKLVKLSAGVYRLTNVGSEAEVRVTVWWRDAPHDWTPGDPLPE